MVARQRRTGWGSRASRRCHPRVPAGGRLYRRAQRYTPECVTRVRQRLHACHCLAGTDPPLGSPSPCPHVPTSPSRPIPATAAPHARGCHGSALRHAGNARPSPIAHRPPPIAHRPAHRPAHSTHGNARRARGDDVTKTTGCDWLRARAGRRRGAWPVCGGAAMDAGGGGGQSRVQGGPGSGGDEKPAPLWGRDRRDPPAGPEKEQELVSVAREAESRGGGGVIGSPSGRVTSPG